MSGCGCGATWTGKSTCHCGGCHRTFSSLSGFDRHQTALPEHPWVVCRDPATMRKKDGSPVLVLSGDTWRWPGEYNPRA